MDSQPKRSKSADGEKRKRKSTKNDDKKKQTKKRKKDETTEKELPIPQPTQEKDGGSPSRPTSPESCSICLGDLQNKSFTDSCFHMFCFVCLKEWSKVKAECPLCKQKFKNIIYNVKSYDKYDKYNIDQANKNQRDEMDRLFRYRTTVTFQGRFTIGSEHDYVQPIARPSRSNITTRSHWRRRREPATSDFRRRIYRNGMRAIEVPETRLRTRECTPQFYSQNPAQTHRLVPWLNRELNALLRNQPDHVELVMDIIMGSIKRFTIDSEEFYQHIYPYVGRHTRHFMHEFMNFAKSPYNMPTYDAHVNYQNDSADANVTQIDESSDDMGNLDTDDDTVDINGPIISLQCPQVVRRPNYLLNDDNPTPYSSLYRSYTDIFDNSRNRFSAPTSASGWDSPTPGPSWTGLNDIYGHVGGSSSMATVPVVGNRASSPIDIESSGGSDSDSTVSVQSTASDIVFVKMDKAWEERSPITLLSSDSSDVEANIGLDFEHKHYSNAKSKSKKKKHRKNSRESSKERHKHKKHKKHKSKEKSPKSSTHKNKSDDVGENSQSSTSHKNRDRSSSQGHSSSDRERLSETVGDSSRGSYKATSIATFKSMLRERSLSKHKNKVKSSRKSQDKEKSSKSKERDRSSSKSQNSERSSSKCQDRERSSFKSQDRERSSSKSWDSERSLSKSQDRERSSSKSQDRERGSPKSQDREEYYHKKYRNHCTNHIDDKPRGEPNVKSVIVVPNPTKDSSSKVTTSQNQNESSKRQKEHSYKKHSTGHKNSGKLVDIVPKLIGKKVIQFNIKDKNTNIETSLASTTSQIDHELTSSTNLDEDDNMNRYSQIENNHLARKSQQKTAHVASENILSLENSKQCIKCNLLYIPELLNSQGVCLTCKKKRVNETATQMQFNDQEKSYQMKYDLILNENRVASMNGNNEYLTQNESATTDASLNNQRGNKENSEKRKVDKESVKCENDCNFEGPLETKDHNAETNNTMDVKLKTVSWQSEAYPHTVPLINNILPLHFGLSDSSQTQKRTDKGLDTCTIDTKSTGNGIINNSENNEVLDVDGLDSDECEIVSSTAPYDFIEKTETVCTNNAKSFSTYSPRNRNMSTNVENNEEKYRSPLTRSLEEMLGDPLRIDFSNPPTPAKSTLSSASLNLMSSQSPPPWSLDVSNPPTPSNYWPGYMAPRSPLYYSPDSIDIAQGRSSRCVLPLWQSDYNEQLENTSKSYDKIYRSMAGPFYSSSMVRKYPTSQREVIDLDEKEENCEIINVEDNENDEDDSLCLTETKNLDDSDEIVDCETIQIDGTQDSPEKTMAQALSEQIVSRGLNSKAPNVAESANKNVSEENGIEQPSSSDTCNALGEPNHDGNSSPEQDLNNYKCKNGHNTTTGAQDLTSDNCKSHESRQGVNSTNDRIENLEIPNSSSISANTHVENQFETNFQNTRNLMKNGDHQDPHDKVTANFDESTSSTVHDESIYDMDTESQGSESDRDIEMTSQSGLNSVMNDNSLNNNTIQSSQVPFQNQPFRFTNNFKAIAALGSNLDSNVDISDNSTLNKLNFENVSQSETNISNLDTQSSSEDSTVEEPRQIPSTIGNKLQGLTAFSPSVIEEMKKTNRLTFHNILTQGAGGETLERNDLPLIVVSEASTAVTTNSGKDSVDNEFSGAENSTSHSCMTDCNLDSMESEKNSEISDEIYIESGLLDPNTQVSSSGFCQEIQSVANISSPITVNMETSFCDINNFEMIADANANRQESSLIDNGLGFSGKFLECAMSSEFSKETTTDLGQTDNCNQSTNQNAYNKHNQEKLLDLGNISVGTGTQCSNDNLTIRDGHQDNIVQSNESNASSLSNNVNDNPNTIDGFVDSEADERSTNLNFVFDTCRSQSDNLTSNLGNIFDSDTSNDSN